VYRAGALRTRPGEEAALCTPAGARLGGYMLSGTGAAVGPVGEAFDIVRSGYDRIVVRYREWSSVSPTRLNFVRRLLRGLTPGSLVVELGCGPGEPATRLLAAEHRVLALDASVAQLRLAREAAPTAALVQADMARLHLRAGSADAVASFYALGHLPSHEHAPLLNAIAHWLRQPACCSRALRSALVTTATRAGAECPCTSAASERQ